jgi:carbonic anhydrase
MKQTMQASPAQMALFSRLYPLNARPIQPSNGRIVKESN